MGSHQKTFTALVSKHRWTRGAELGVDRGWLSRKLLDAVPTLRLIGVDNFSLNPQYRHEVDAVVEEYGGRFELMAMDASEAANLVEDGSLDFAFLDADHSEAATFREIVEWRAKVRKGGWFGGDAYNPPNYPGVVRAVHRVFAKADVHVLPGRVWGVWC